MSNENKAPENLGSIGGLKTMKTEGMFPTFYNYALHKMSGPSWSFYTDDVEVVTEQLKTCICQDCRVSEDLDVLLETLCGREFLLEENVTFYEKMANDNDV